MYHHRLLVVFQDDSYHAMFRTCSGSPLNLEPDVDSCADLEHSGLICCDDRYGRIQGRFIRLKDFIFFVFLNFLLNKIVENKLKAKASISLQVQGIQLVEHVQTFEQCSSSIPTSAPHVQDLTTDVCQFLRVTHGLRK